MSKKIAIVGDNYVSRAFESVADIFDDSRWLYYSEDFDDYQIIIYNKDFDDVSCKNVEFLQEDMKTLRDLQRINGKKIIYISTADLYGNNHDWKKNIETNVNLDIGTDFRFLKLLGEKLCPPDSLILRIRNPFDSRVHPDNAVVKGYTSSKMYAWADTWTYLPDLVKAVEKLTEIDAKGIYNVVNTEMSSLFFILKGILNVPFFKEIDPVKEDIPNFLISEHSSERIHNDTNNSKLSEIFQMSNLDAAMILSWNKGLKQHFLSVFDEKKFLQQLNNAL